MRFFSRRHPAPPTCPHCGGRARWTATGFAWDGPQPTTLACAPYLRHLERTWGSILVKGI